MASRVQEAEVAAGFDVSLVPAVSCGQMDYCPLICNLWTDAQATIVLARIQEAKIVLREDGFDDGLTSNVSLRCMIDVDDV